MDLATVGNLVSSIGFPVVSCIALFWGCKYMLDNQQKNTDRMLDMYDKANTQNREAIESCTKAIDKLCDRLEDLDKMK